MQFRKTEVKDLERVMEIIKEAQGRLKSLEVDQWQNNYPNEEVILQDIKSDDSYVILENEKIIGTVYVSFDREPTYDVVYNGEWKTQEEYAVIHRIAVSTTANGRGIATKMIDFIVDMCKERNVNSIKIDTHEKNIPMQKVLYKNGFELCGTILLTDGDPRIALERVIKSKVLV